MAAPLRRLLRPLVRLMVRCGVTYPVACELLRSLYIDVAADTLGPQRTDSRVSLLTGIHRKELRKQRIRPPDEPAPPRLSLNSLLIATWLGAPGYTDADGRPVKLPRASTDGVSFDALVASVTRDVRPRAVLDDWLAQGIVTMDALDQVCLSPDAFLPKPGQDEQLFYFARNLADHAAAAAANILADGPAPFLDRSVHYDRLTPDAAAELERFGRAVAQRALLDVNRRAQELAKEPAPGPAKRVNWGVYLLSEDEPPE